MSISLTWVDYALIVSLCLLIYYAIIAIVYRKTFQHLVAKRTNLSFDSLEVPSSTDVSGPQSSLNLFGEEVPDEELKTVEDADDLASDAQEFAGEIEAYTSSSGDAVNKEELIASLRKIIQKYPCLNHSEPKYELRQLIAVYCENYCSIHLSAEELQALWND